MPSNSPQHTTALSYMITRTDGAPSHGLNELSERLWAFYKGGPYMKDLHIHQKKWCLGDEDNKDVWDNMGPEHMNSMDVGT